MHIAARSGVASFSVATVDHGLRADSRAEAEAVGETARRLGLQHAILDWRGDKPKTGLQAAARAARYALLVRHAHEMDADAIVVAHTADDQAETVAMRAARDAGARGLAGMKEVMLIAAGASEPVALLRPFLNVRRGALRAFLTDAGAAFVDDPSNRDHRFERVRIRETLAREGEPAIDDLLRKASLMRAEAERIEAAEVARFAALAGSFAATGAARLAIPAISDAGLIARLVGAIGGGEYPPPESAAAHALKRALAGEAASLGGALIERDEAGLALRREPAAIFGRAGVAPLPPLAIAPGARVLWDRRFTIENRTGAAGIVEALGARAAEFAASTREASALSAAPALLVGDEIVAIAGESDAIRSLSRERFFGRVNRFAIMPNL
jgi:tRNA(Ile)-lysidine synthase